MKKIKQNKFNLKLSKKLFPVLLASFLLIQPFSALILVNTVNAETCADECAYIGQRQESGDSYRICGNYDSDCCYEWSQWYTNTPTCNPTCADECAYIGQKKCSDSTHTQTCGNYDSDCCFEWSSPQSCGSGQVCQNGTCVAQQVNDPVTGSLVVSSYSVCVGKSISITLTGQDDNGMVQLKLMVEKSGVTENTFTHDCSGASCSKTWEVVKNVAGQYKLTAKFFGKKPDGTNEVYSIDDIYIEFKSCPISVDIKANGSNGPINVSCNSNVNLTWTSQNANSCQASGDWSGSKPTSGSETAGPLNVSKTYTFAITCTGTAGSASDEVKVNVEPCCQLPQVTTLNATNISQNSAVLNGRLDSTGNYTPVEVWFQYGKNSSYGYETSHQLKYSIGEFSANIYSLTSCTTYHFRAAAKNNVGTSYGQDKVFDTQCPSVSVDIKANGSNGPITIPYNSSANLTWTSQNADSCTASGAWSGTKAISGSESTGNLTSSKTYTLTCQGLGGSASDSVTINVSQNHPPIANAGPNKEIYETESVILEGSGSDPDGDQITFHWTCTGGTLSNSSIAQPIFYSPIVSSDTTYTCTLTVTDSHNASDSDSVNILVKEHHCLTLSVSLSANPNSGCAPLNNVDLTASVSGTASGEIIYFFDCTNDGVWEKTITSGDSIYTASDLCNYSSAGNYTAKTRVQREGLSAENTTQIAVQSCYSNHPPIADAGSDKDIYENQSVTLNGSGYDPDGYSVTYYWSCTGGYLSNRYIAQPTFDAPSVSSNTYYTCNLTVTDNEGLTDFDSMRVLVREKTYSSVSLDVSKSVKNLSRGDTQWYHSYRSADPDDRLLFQIEIESTGSMEARDVMVKDSLPDNIIYEGNLRIDDVYSSKNISTQTINIGDLSPGQIKTITFEAKVASKDKFSYGTTDLINTALVYNTETSDSDTCKVIVKKTAVAGAVTEISTGITNGILNSILLPLFIAFAVVWIFRSKFVGLDKWSEKKKKETEEYRANKLLKKKIAQLRTQGIV